MKVSRQSESKYQRNVGLARPQRLNRDRHGLDADAFTEAQNQREKKRDDEAFLQRQFVERPPETRRRFR